ncbi:unnamed protein product [Caenorhabditis auriculariae]|uniref:DUF38 domain-containing protein n=1 Tax=Caenorhabditis auriculariae TaxID=2777116 RepID=A0A8S1HL94_9PELO|nr:unnamed protein product [Caenorhabditis auriculariae]
MLPQRLSIQILFLTLFCSLLNANEKELTKIVEKMNDFTVKRDHTAMAALYTQDAQIVYCEMTYVGNIDVERIYFFEFSAFKTSEISLKSVDFDSLTATFEHWYHDDNYGAFVIVEALNFRLVNGKYKISRNVREQKCRI